MYIHVCVCVQVARKEYRGQRSVDAIVEFVRTQLNPPVEVIRGTHELAQKVRQSEWLAKKCCLVLLKTSC